MKIKDLPKPIQDFFKREARKTKRSCDVFHADSLKVGFVWHENERITYQKFEIINEECKQSGMYLYLSGY